MASVKCTTCGKAVYAMEQAKAVGKIYHKTCLKCKSCSKLLKDGNFCDSGGEVYCNHCYESKFVDDETKQIVQDMENTYSKKVHGTGKAMPGMASTAPPKVVAPIKNVSHAPPPPSAPGSFGGATSPRKVLPPSLLAGISAQGGKVPRK